MPSPGIISDPSEVNRIEVNILQRVYRKCDGDVALSRLIDHTIKVKKILGDGAAKVAVSRFFAVDESQVKFSDEQLLRLLDEMPYAQNHVSKVLKYRQKEHNSNEDERH